MSSPPNSSGHSKVPRPCWVPWSAPIPQGPLWNPKYPKVSPHQNPLGSPDPAGCSHPTESPRPCRISLKAHSRMLKPFQPTGSHPTGPLRHLQGPQTQPCPPDLPHPAGSLWDPQIHWVPAHWIPQTLLGPPPRRVPWTPHIWQNSTVHQFQTQQTPLKDPRPRWVTPHQVVPGSCRVPKAPHTHQGSPDPRTPKPSRGHPIRLPRTL